MEKSIFVNKEGYEWHIDNVVTQYAHQEGLKNLICYLVKKDNSTIRVLVDTITRKDIYSCWSLEGMAAHIDILKMEKRKC